jgi:hypothetical protein
MCSRHSTPSRLAALKLCGASNVNVFTFDGELIHLEALVNLSPAGAEALRGLWPQKPSRGMAAAARDSDRPDGRDP